MRQPARCPLATALTGSIGPLAYLIRRESDIAAKTRATPAVRAVG